MVTNMEYLRKVTIEDMDLLYCWANDVTVRANAFSTEQIPYENHKKWFAARMEDVNTIMYLMICEEKPVGQIRLTVDQKQAVIDYSIAKEYRGKGYGKKMLSLLEKNIKEEYPQIKTLVAEVKSGNEASKNAFLKSDFKESYVTYEKEI